MLNVVITQLRCPVCSESLTWAGSGPGSSLTCVRRHSFDLARQGYVDLTAGRSAHQGDTADMLAAREAVHTAGHLDGVKRAVVEAAAGALGETAVGETAGDGGGSDGRFLVEVGAGTGTYLAAALEADPAGYGLAVDVSKAALRRAARAHPRMAAVRADIWQGLPLRDGSVDVLLDVFAPRSGVEFARVLARGGVLVVAAADPAHLGELTGPLGLVTVDPDKRDRLAASLDPWLVRESARLVRYPIAVSRAEAGTLIGMGPSAHHVTAEDLAGRLAAFDEPITATVAVEVSTWRPRT